MAKILYLEDETNIREVTKEYLVMAGHQVDDVVDGTTALSRIASNHYDIAILDIMVPHVSGLDVLSEIMASHRDMAVIMLSALSDDMTQLEAFNRHADDYMMKPFSPLLLLKRVDAILRRTDGGTQKQGLVVDVQQANVFIDTQSLNFTYTEFLLFHALYAHPTRVFTREMLLDIIAPEDFMVSERVVDAHIKNIRKKLPVPCIKTIIGLGYQYQECDDATLI